MYYFITIFSRIISFLPIKLMYGVASFITTTVFMLWKEKRDNIYNNYKILLTYKNGKEPTPGEIKKLMKANFKNYAMFNVEFLYLEKMVKQGIVPELKNKKGVDKALENKKGIVMCTLHFSNWDIAGLTISAHYDNVYAVADDLGGGYSRYIQETRGKYGIHVVLPNKNLKDAYKCLSSNGIINVLVDRPVPRTEKSGVEVDFCGKKAYVATAAARFALKYNSKVMVGCLVRDGDSFYGNPASTLDFEASGDYDKDVKELTQEMLKVAEKIILEHPEQWYMFRDFWA